MALNGKKVIALIPLRGGSKRIPRKNIKMFSGKPLAYWVASEAAQSKYIDAIHVSTEDAEIKDVVENMGIDISVTTRPHELAQDMTSEEHVHLHFMEQVPFDILVVLHATNPLTTTKDIDNALELLEKHQHDALLTGTRHKRFYWTPEGKPLNYNPLKRPRTQDFEGTITENGAFYITRNTTLEKYKNFLGGTIGIYEMSPEQAIDIDHQSDWDEAERIFKKKKGV